MIESNKETTKVKKHLNPECLSLDQTRAAMSNLTVGCY